MNIQVRHHAGITGKHIVWYGQMIDVEAWEDCPDVEILYRRSGRSDWYFSATMPLPEGIDITTDEGMTELGRLAREFLYDNGDLSRRRKGTHRPRDAQRQKLYDAEHKITLWTQPVYFKSVAQAQSYVDRILESKWWKTRFPKVTEVHLVESTKRAQSAHATKKHGRNELVFPHFKRSPSTWHKAFVLHELAHAATTGIGAPYRYGKVAGHGWQYAATYLAIIGRFGYCTEMDGSKVTAAESAQQLKKSFQKGGVRFKPKKTRAISEEHRAALVERIAVARAAKQSKKEMEYA